MNEPMHVKNLLFNFIESLDHKIEEHKKTDAHKSGIAEARCILAEPNQDALMSIYGGNKTATDFLE